MKVGIIAENYTCVGTSVTSFDENGKCVNSDLPWVDIQGFQDANSIADRLSRREFYCFVRPDIHVEDEVEGHVADYLESDGVYMIYDADTDRHYFFA